jgi:hypothetical protein
MEAKCVMGFSSFRDAKGAARKMAIQSSKGRELITEAHIKIY